MSICLGIIAIFPYRLLSLSGVQVVSVNKPNTCAPRQQQSSTEKSVSRSAVPALSSMLLKKIYARNRPPPFAYKHFRSRSPMVLRRARLPYEFEQSAIRRKLFCGASGRWEGKQYINRHDAIAQYEIPAHNTHSLHTVYLSFASQCTHTRAHDARARVRTGNIARSQKFDCVPGFSAVKYVYILDGISGRLWSYM